MSCTLSSSFSQESRLTGSTQVWAPQTLPVGNFYFGASTKVVPYDDSVYTFVGQPGAQAHWSNTHPARHYDDQGSIFIFKSGSSGFEQEIVIGPSGSANPNQNEPSNYLAINPTGSGGASYFTSDYAIFGKSIDAVSSSAGLHFAVAGPGMANYAGRILLFQSSSNGIEMLEDPGEQLTGSQEQPGGATVGLDSTTYSQAGTFKYQANYSDRTAISYGGYGIPNDAVSIMFDDEEENLYVSFYDSLLSDAGGTSTTGGIRLYKSSSLGGIEHLKDITVSSPITNEQVGSAHQMIVADGKIYIAASGYVIPRDPGQAYLFTYDISAGTYTEDIYYPASSFSDPDGEVYTENFGTGTPDIVSGSDGIYILQGSAKRHDTDPHTPYDGLGRLYLFKSSSSGISTVSSFTGSNDDHEYGYNFFGGTAQIMSGNSGLVIVSSEYSGALVGSDSWGTPSPRVWVYETGSNLNTSYYIGADNSTEISSISPTTPTMGRVLDAQISNDGETLHLATSDPTWDGNKGATLLYEWGLSGSCSQQQGENNNMVAKRGIAVYTGSATTVHKFLDDGTSIIGGNTTTSPHQVTGTLHVSGTNAYDIAATGKISGSFYYGDGQHLTNVVATEIEAAGNNHYIQYNIGDDLAAEEAFTYNPTSNTLGLGLSGAGGSLTGSDSLTITAGAASTWSTSAGALTIDGAGGLTLDSDGTDAVNLGTEAAAKTITIGNAASTKVDVNALALDFDSAAATDILAATTLSAKGATGASFGDDTGTWEFDGSGAVTETGMTSLTATPSAAITLTAGAASTWSTSAGALTLDGAAGMVLDANAGDLDITATLVDVTGAGTFSGVLKTDNTTEATSTTDGSLQTDGGLSVAKSAVIGDDLDLLSDGAIVNIGSTSKFTLTDQAANNTAMASSGHRLAFGNAGEYISGDGTDLDIISSGDLDITATLVDVTGAGTFSGVLKTDDTTDATSKTDGSLQTDGGLSVAKAMYNGTAATLAADSGVVTMGSTTAATISAAGVVNVNNATDATSKTDGSLQTDGGLSVAKAMYNGTAATFAADSGVVTMGSTTAATISAAGLLNINNATDATSKTDGSLQTDGGLSVAKAMYNGTAATFAADSGVVTMGSTTAATISAAGVVNVNNATDATSKTDGSLQTDGGLSVAKAMYNGTAATFAADSGVVTMGSTTAATISAAGLLNINNATDATSTTDGSLQTDGGLSVVKSAVIGADLDVAGDSTLGDTVADVATVNGRLQIGKFNPANTPDAAALETMAATPATYNGSMIYLSIAAATGTVSAATFANTNKWYFCESGSWYPSPFSSD